VQDGLQLQRRYRDDLDVVEAIDAFWRLVAAARETWARQDRDNDEKLGNEDSG
jgi:hypothetical protein